MFDTHLASLAIAALTVAFLAQLAALVWLTSVVIRHGQARSVFYPAVSYPEPKPGETLLGLPAQRISTQGARPAGAPALSVVPPLKQHAYDDGPDAVAMVVGNTGETAQVPPPRTPRTDDMGGAGLGDAAEQIWEDVRSAQER